MPLTLQVHEATEKQIRKRKATALYFTAICHPLPPLVFSSTHPTLLYCHCKDQEGERKRERDETERLKKGGEGGREGQRKRERVSRQTLCNFSEAVSFHTSRYSLMGQCAAFTHHPRSSEESLEESWFLLFLTYQNYRNKNSNSFFFIFYYFNLCLNIPLSSIPKTKIH